VSALDVARRAQVYFAADYLNGALYFYQNGALWKSDGTQAGTTKVRDLGLYETRVALFQLSASSTSIVIALTDAHDIGQLWLSDGTTAGTFKEAPLGTLSGATPTITGTPTLGTKLAGRVGTWTPTGVTFTYQWKADGVSIAGATTKYFTVTSAQAGKKLTLSVTGSKAGYATTTKTSAATAAVSANFTTAPVPTVTGSTKVGSTLTAHPGTWSPNATFKYQWYANGTAIKNSGTSSTYKIVGALKGKTMTVHVTGSHSGYLATTKGSEKTAKITS
jgi:hypothetical protein